MDPPERLRGRSRPSLVGTLGEAMATLADSAPWPGRRFCSQDGREALSHPTCPLLSNSFLFSNNKSCCGLCEFVALVDRVQRSRCCIFFFLIKGGTGELSGRERFDSVDTPLGVADRTLT